MEIRALSPHEAKALAVWYEDHKTELPQDIQALMDKAITLLSNLALVGQQKDDVLKYLNQLMGLLPKSESGSSLTKHLRGAFKL